jgi:hypothetical protein
MAELERQASATETPESTIEIPTEVTRRSITSSALTSLLPIAAASGIVQPNYNTPKISFYSPSGRLIQPEGSSSPETPGSDWGTPTASTSYYNRTNTLTANTTLSSAACFPPARPSLFPMTTPPTTTAQLPAHLRYHHNYRQPEKSQINSCESLIMSGPAVKGCDGVIRANIPAPISAVRHSPHKRNKSSPQHKRHRSTKSLVRDLRGDANFYKSRLIHKAVQSCSSAAEQSKQRSRATLVKNHTLRIDPAYPFARASKPHNRTTHALGRSREKPAQLPSTPAALKVNKDTEFLGPLAGHALRICFCQPYDGAGRETAEAPCMRKQPSSTRIRGTKAVVGESEVEPAARVVKPVPRKEKATRRVKDAAV